MSARGARGAAALLAAAVAAGCWSSWHEQAVDDVGAADHAEATRDTDAAPEAAEDAGADIDAALGRCPGGFLDPLHDLCWQDPAAPDLYRWEAAVAYCAGLTAGGRAAGTWRLPTIGELRSLIRGCPPTEAGGPCGLTDDCHRLGCPIEACSGCAYHEGPGADGAYWPPELTGHPLPWVLWSSTTRDDYPSYSYAVGFGQAYVNGFPQSDSDRVRCVRTGP